MKDLLRILVQNIGKVAGTVLAFFIALSIVLFGFLNTIFIILCVLLGFYVGTLFDQGFSIRKTIKDIISLLRLDKWR